MDGTTFTCNTIGGDAQSITSASAGNQITGAVLKQKLMVGLISIKVCALSFE